MKKHWCFALIFLGLFSCQNPDSSNNFRLLKERLLDKNGVPVTEESMKFVVISDQGCLSCKKRMLRVLEHENRIDGLHIIVCGLYANEDTYARLRDKYKDKIIHDEDELMTRLDIDLFGTGVFIIEDESITQVKTFVPDEQGLQELHSFLVIESLSN